MLYEVDVPLVFSIISCESNWQADATNTNVGGSIDYGLFQINNQYQATTAKEFKLNPKNVKDNIQLGFIILKREGTRPWKSSYKCMENFLGKPLQQDFSNST